MDHHRPLYALARSRRRFYDFLRRYLLIYNIRYSEGSALIWAAKKDRRNLARRLLRFGASINSRGKPQHPRTPLHFAAKAGHLGMIQLLLRKGGDPEARGIDGYKPLLLALCAGHEEIAIILFRNSKTPDSQIAGNAGYTPLHAVCSRRLIKPTRVFLEYCADVHARSSAGWSPLYLALKSKAFVEDDNIAQCCTLQLIMLLFDSGSLKDVRTCSLGLRHPYSRIRNLFAELGN